MLTVQNRKLNSRTLDWPTDWAALFGRRAPLLLEIGFGKGAFLLHLARTHPDHNLIGIEISNRCLVTVEHAIGRERIANLRVLHSTAETALHHLFEPKALEQIHINFPDPWFKTRHGHRRLMQRDTLDTIASRLKPGGMLYLATDILEYAEMSAELLADTPLLDNTLPGVWTHEPLPGRVVTKYEAKARREGRACYYFAYQRNDRPSPTIPVIQECIMPHLVFRSPSTLDEIAAQFAESEIHPAPETYVHVMAVYRGRGELLFEIHAKEPTIDQHFLLSLSAKDDQKFTLQLSTIGHPRPTDGVHYAVAHVGDWLLRLHPDAQMIVKKLAPEADEES